MLREKWDCEIAHSEVMWPYCLMSEKDGAAAAKILILEKRVGPSGVVSKMIKASGGLVLGG